MATRTILMADIIGSRRRSPELLMEQFSGVCEAANREFRPHLKSPITITLGDEFQCVVGSWESGVYLILFLEEEMVRRDLAFSLRYVLSQGDIGTRVNPEVAYGMLGEGLTRARETLESSKRSDSRFRFLDGPEPSCGLLNRLFVVYAALRDAWRPGKDLPLVAHLIQDPDYRSVAAAVGKDPSQIWKRKRTLGIVPYLELREALCSVARMP